MNTLLFVTIFIGNLTVTSYRSVPAQTDDSPFHTSTGEHVCKHGVAVSQDLLKKNGGNLEYGDYVYIEGIGIKVVNDAMNKRWTNRMDVYVSSLDEEKKFHKKFKGRKLSVSKILLEGNQYARRQIFQ